MKTLRMFCEIWSLLEIQNNTFNNIERRLLRFSEWCSYSCNLDDIIIYINEIKEKYSYSELNKTILAIRMLMREIGAPFADKIKLPRKPKT